MKLFYLATPYSHPDPIMRQIRYDAACDTAARLMAVGYPVFAPIAHSHPLAIRSGVGTDWEYWAAFDERFIGACDALLIDATIVGWDKSKGVAAEIEIANRLGKTVYHLRGWHENGQPKLEGGEWSKT